jgi:hypothetical protein
VPPTGRVGRLKGSSTCSPTVRSFGPATPRPGAPAAADSSPQDVQ